jgi:transposase-like protein
MNSTVGRPRALTDAQVEAILAWHRGRRSVKEVAREYGVSPNTILGIIRRNGEYKQASPERRGAVAARRRQRLAELEARHCL